MGHGENPHQPIAGIISEKSEERDEKA